MTRPLTISEVVLEYCKLKHKVFFWFSSEFKNLVFLGFLKLKIKKYPNFKVTSNITYVLETGKPQESAGKDRTTFSLKIKALKKTHPVKIDLLVTNGSR